MTETQGLLLGDLSIYFGKEERVIMCIPKDTHTHISLSLSYSAYVGDFILHGADAGLVLCCRTLETLGQRPEDQYRYGCFFKLEILFACPCKKSPSIWGLH